MITHYQRLLNYIVPDYVHVLADGRIVKSGGKELALELESRRGYGWLECAAEATAAASPRSMTAMPRGLDGSLPPPQRLGDTAAASACHGSPRCAERALERFASTGFPTPRDEDWKYTNVRAAREQPVFAARHPPQAEATGDQRGCADVCGGGIIGWCSSTAASRRTSRRIGALPAGVRSRSLGEALRAARAGETPRARASSASRDDAIRRAQHRVHRRRRRSSTAPRDVALERRSTAVHRHRRGTARSRIRATSSSPGEGSQR